MKLPTATLKKPSHSLIVAAVILVGFTFFLLLLLLTISLAGKKPDVASVPETPAVSDTVPTAVATFVLDGPWRVGLQKQVAVDLAYTPHTPLVTALSISFDPAFLKVENVSANDFWTQTRIMEQKIDNQDGVINLQIIQDREAQPTGDPTMAIVSFTAINVGTSNLSLNSKSHLVSTGVDQTIPLQAESLAITIRP
jgi:hypothetical protein